MHSSTLRGSGKHIDILRTSPRTPETPKQHASSPRARPLRTQTATHAHTTRRRTHGTSPPTTADAQRAAEPTTQWDGNFPPEPARPPRARTHPDWPQPWRRAGWRGASPPHPGQRCAARAGGDEARRPRWRRTQRPGIAKRTAHRTKTPHTHSRACTATAMLPSASWHRTPTQQAHALLCARRPRVPASSSGLTTRANWQGSAARAAPRHVTLPHPI